MPPSVHDRKLAGSMCPRGGRTSLHMYTQIVAENQKVTLLLPPKRCLGRPLGRSQQASALARCSASTRRKRNPPGSHHPSKRWWEMGLMGCL